MSIPCVIENNVLVINADAFYTYSHSRTIPLKKLIACKIDGQDVELHFLNEQNKWDIITLKKYQFNKISQSLKQHPDFIYAVDNYTYYINIETLTKLDIYLYTPDVEKISTLQFMKNGDTAVKQDYKHKVFFNLTFANKLHIELFPNSLKKALENHPTGLTDKSKAILEFMKSKNIDGNIMHGV